MKYSLPLTVQCTECGNQLYIHLIEYNCGIIIFVSPCDECMKAVVEDYRITHSK